MDLLVWRVRVAVRGGGSRGRRAATAVFLLAAALIAAAPVSSAPDPVVLRLDYGAGTVVPPWHALQAASPSRVTVTDDPAGGVGKVARFELLYGDLWSGSARLELYYKPNGGTELNGEDDYYALSVFFPPGFQPPSKWGIFTQFHGADRVTGQPPLAFEIRPNGQLRLSVRGGDVSAPQVRAFDPPGMTIVPGRWNDFILHWRKSYGSDGLTELWFRRQEDPDLFTQVVSYTGPNFYAQSGVTLPAYIKQGYYRDPGKASDPTFPGVVYHRGIWKTTSFDSALSYFGPPLPPGPDTTPPTITNRQPAPNATGVATDTNVVTAFSEVLAAGGVSAGSVSLAPAAGGPAVGAALSLGSGNTVVTLNPTADLAAGTQYRATITTAVTDASGTPLAAEDSWTFTTAAAAPGDTTPPAITNRQPAPSASDVAVSANVVTTFNEALAAGSVSASSVSLAPAAGGPAVGAALSLGSGNTVVTLNPTADLAAGTQYRATITTAVTDASGTPLAAEDSWTFTTAAATPPPAGAFIESGGQVVIEAESFSQNITRAGKTWTATSALPGAVGTALQVLPNSGTAISTNFAATSPQLRFPVQFQTPGTYRVWLRGYGATTSDDSAHAGLNGAFVATADAMNIGKLARWWWFNATHDNAPSAIVIPSAGTYTVDVWMREDGFVLDRLLLRTSTAALTADTAGPAESPRS